MPVLKRKHNYRKHDISIYGQSGIYWVSSDSQAGHEWLVDNVVYDDWQSSEDGARGTELSVVVEGTGNAEDITEGALLAGLRVMVNGRSVEVGRRERK